ncbi:MAG: response regulator transcription factor [Deltaproteobacteria bacterium]|nr:response regulator transcription factor [Deltaproteobacteria bacterium]
MRVLVVDDDADFRFLVGKALLAHGHAVDELPSAFGLVNTVAAIGADVVVLDCGLPGLSGTGALELLARDRRTQHVPVLLVSAAASEQARAMASLHGNAQFVEKGLRLGRLVQLVEGMPARTSAAARERSRT